MQVSSKKNEAQFRALLLQATAPGEDDDDLSELEESEPEEETPDSSDLEVPDAVTARRCRPYSRAMVPP